jgi:hypothetical protein
VSRQITTLSVTDDELELLVLSVLTNMSVTRKAMDDATDPETYLGYSRTFDALKALRTKLDQYRATDQ